MLGFPLIRPFHLSPDLLIHPGPFPALSCVLMFDTFADVVCLVRNILFHHLRALARGSFSSHSGCHGLSPVFPDFRL